jgi:hypothetical protein
MLKNGGLLNTPFNWAQIIVNTPIEHPLYECCVRILVILRLNATLLDIF